MHSRSSQYLHGSVILPLNLMLPKLMEMLHFQNITCDLNAHVAADFAWHQH